MEPAIQENPPKVDYDLRVASYYPRKCDRLVPFAGVPTEELARRANVNERAGKGHHRTHTSDAVRQCMEYGGNTENAGKLELFGKTKRRAPPAQSQLWFAFNSQDAFTTQHEERHRSGRRQPLMRRDLISDALIHEDRKEEELWEERRSRKMMDLNNGFSDVHGLYPVVHKNQETSDMKPRGLHRPLRKHLEGYNGCVDVGHNPIREFQRSNIEAFEGFIAPKNRDLERRARPINRGSSIAPAAVCHLTGGAIPLPGHQDSFEGRKRRMKEPTILKQFRNLEIQNQDWELETGLDLGSRGITNHVRRRVVQPNNVSSPNDLYQRPRFKRTPDAQAHVDHIWDLNRGWGKDSLRSGPDKSLYDDPYPWQAIDEEKELEYDLPNYLPAGHDPPRPKRSSGEVKELDAEACWKKPNDEASEGQGKRMNTETAQTSEEKGRLPGQGLDRIRVGENLDDLYKCDPIPKLPEDHGSTEEYAPEVAGELDSFRIHTANDDARKFEGRASETTGCRLQNSEDGSNLRKDTPHSTKADLRVSFSPEASQTRPSDASNSSSANEKCFDGDNTAYDYADVPAIAQSHTISEDKALKARDNCPVAGESAQTGVEPREHGNLVPPHSYVDDLPLAARFTKDSPHFGRSAPSSEGSDSDPDAHRHETQKLRMVSHMAVPRSSRTHTAKNGERTYTAEHGYATGHFRTAYQRGPSVDPEPNVSGQVEPTGSSNFRTQAGREMHPRPSNPTMDWGAHPADIYDRQATNEAEFQSVDPVRR